MKRVWAAAAVASMSFASFAGCSDDGAAQNPVHSAPATAPSATADCSPTTALVAWDRRVPDGTRVVTAYTLTYLGDGAWAPNFSPLTAKPKWADSGLSAITHTTDERRAWREALLASARRTGQVDADFGTALTFRPEDAPPAAPSKGSSHQFVGTLVKKSVTMPFTIHCGGDIGDVVGSVSAVIDDGQVYALYDCTLAATTREARSALEYCG
jgi:hypothetical protein